MPPDATETKRRILTAARDEFSRFGLAGARVDRIAETAHANKRSIYVHFGPKEQLFDIVVVEALSRMASAVPFTAADLDGYAGRLYDYLTAHPKTLRLSTWATLERPTATEGEVDAYRPKVDALRPRFGDAAIDVLAIVLGVVSSHHLASPALLSLGRASPQGSQGEPRASIVRAVAALTQELGLLPPRQ